HRFHGVLSAWEWCRECRRACSEGMWLGWTHTVENAFARLKHYRAVAFRYDKLKRNYESMVAMACGFLWLPM
ncbi:Transposase DDE domain-containing protein, partial [Azotobacter beijerinckii]